MEGVGARWCVMITAGTGVNRASGSMLPGQHPRDGSLLEEGWRTPLLCQELTTDKGGWSLLGAMADPLFFTMK